MPDFFYVSMEPLGQNGLGGVGKPSMTIGVCIGSVPEYRATLDDLDRDARIAFAIAPPLPQRDRSREKVIR
jgi:hypothetical protein